jgi:hypothetical protein
MDTTARATQVADQPNRVAASVSQSRRRPSGAPPPLPGTSKPPSGGLTDALRVAAFPAAMTWPPPSGATPTAGWSST